MASIPAPELPDELFEPMRHCRYIVGACGVLRSLALGRWRDALEWDDEFYDDVPDVNPRDVDYMFGKFEALLEELKVELDDAAMGWWDDGQFIEPIVPFPSVVHAAHLMTREGRGDAAAGDLAASTYHELALKIPAGAMDFWRECKYGIPSMRLDFEHGPTNSVWDDHFPDIDYKDLSLRIRDEAHLSWAKMPSLGTPRATADEVVTEPSGAGGGKINTPAGGTDPLILTALIAHHGYSQGSTKTRAPITGRQLARKAGVGDGSVTNFWKKRLGGKRAIGSYQDYVVACRNGQIDYLLTYWNGDVALADALELFENALDRRVQD